MGSHFWGTPTEHFVDTLTNHARSTGKIDSESVAYWICYCSNSQWHIKAELGDGNYKESSFYKALRSGYCRATCMVLDEAALPFTRSWCLFEVLQTYLLVKDKESNFEGLKYCTDRGTIGKKTTNLTCFDIGIS